ncbi:MAG: Gfo/Idh/MocA family oxidoreductase [Kiritimatiellae bacterium]|nr:Gfo/Idh/MocA family oxidoreductase [Kiritimatiellia bacterium]
MKHNRRHFLLGSAAAATLAGCATGKTGVRALKPGEKRRVAMIGYGIQMRTALIPQFSGKSKYCAKLRDTVKIVAVCDCDKTRAEAGAKQVNEIYGDSACKAVLDFREVIADPTIDAVCIATPDHWHAYMCVEAMKHGKDVYCEKPLTFSPEEAKKVIEAQAKYGRVFQTGSMQRSWAEVSEFRAACMIVRNGGIGTLKYVDANYGIGGKKLGGPSHPLRFFDDPKNAAAESDGYEQLGAWGWNMWLGPAKWRPYSNQLAPKGVNKFYPMFWRFDDDIGTGYNGDWGAHHLDIAQWGMDMDKSGPYKIIRSDEPYSTDLYHGGRRQYGMKMLFKGKDGGDIELYPGPFGVVTGSGGWGTVFYGTDGIVAVNRGKIAVWKGTGLVKPDLEIRKQIETAEFMKDKIVAASVGKDYGTDAMVKKDDALAKALATLIGYFKLESAPVQLYKSVNQVVNFCECIETRKETVSPAETGARGAILCQLCNMSYVYDTGFDWDPVRMEFANGTGDPAWLKRANYRNGWDIVV